MTITREGRGGTIVFQCDAKRCAQVCDTQLDDFGDALMEARDKGWQIRKEAGWWKHYCPDESDADLKELHAL
jgi:hypothetical protein